LNVNDHAFADVESKADITGHDLASLDATKLKITLAHTRKSVPQPETLVFGKVHSFLYLLTIHYFELTVGHD